MGLKFRRLYCELHELDCTFRLKTIEAEGIIIIKY